MKLSTNQVNYLNVGLMILSCLMAYVYPFELFLFSYAVLGPLHYLTEISWLHDRNYFVEAKQARRARRGRQSWLILVLVTLLVMLYGFAVEKLQGKTITPVWEIALFYFVFVTALLLVIRNKAIKATLIILTLISLGLFNASRYYALIAFFLVTIIHVFIFTGAFILLGALKSRSRSGILSLVVFITCAVSFFLYSPEATGYTVGDYVRGSYGSFGTLNGELINLFHLGTATSIRDIYESSAGLMVMRLIAFAYTYHYLNWFSKTSIIKWHEISKSRAGLIIALWLFSLAVYAHNYQTVMMALYFLSILHVMLEFPLNHQTFAGISRAFYAGAR